MLLLKTDANKFSGNTRKKSPFETNNKENSPYSLVSQNLNFFQSGSTTPNAPQAQQQSLMNVQVAPSQNHAKNAYQPFFKSSNNTKSVPLTNNTSSDNNNNSGGDNNNQRTSPSKIILNNFKYNQFASQPQKSDTAKSTASLNMIRTTKVDLNSTIDKTALFNPNLSAATAAAAAAIAAVQQQNHIPILKTEV